MGISAYGPAYGELICDERSYNTQLAKYEEAVAVFNDNTLERYVQSRVILIVDDQKDTDKMMRKMNPIPLLKEKKRKLFLHSENVEPTPAWDRIKRRKMSVFAHFH